MHFLSMDTDASALTVGIIKLNGSNYIKTDDCYFKIQVMSLLSLIISPVGMVLNSTVLWFLGFQIRRNAFSVYILNLAGADFLFLHSQFLFYLLAIISTKYSISFKIPLIFEVLAKFAYLSGLSILSTISIERCLCIMWPIWYRCQRPKHTSSVTCVLLWALSLLFALMDGVGCSLLFNSLDPSWCFTFDSITGSWSIVLFVVLCGSSLILLVRIFCGSQRIPVTRLYVTIALTVLFFLICCLPFGISLSIQWSKTLRYVGVCDYFHVELALSCINSCANPFVYFLVGFIHQRKFQQKTLKLLLQRAMEDTPEEESEDRGPSRNPEEPKAV
ncbi:mas-related G-protein coupled receptor member B2-like [Mastomys coucha]|uniref:mas-related G-protein coupled receptor member B2-like n=1 Tax=Mastomys coucha TaxID=35658 RepID=UPI001262215A|nr:mas-related G-protein coupled receptor member B2-like [Mastomys coucha]